MTPSVIGLLVCEQVIVDKDTNNLSIINCFTKRNIKSFPSDPQRFAVVAFMTEAAGDIPVELTVQRLDNLDVIRHYGITVAFPHPLQEVRFVFRVNDCVFPVAGDYDICLLTDDAVLAQHRIRVG